MGATARKQESRRPGKRSLRTKEKAMQQKTAKLIASFIVTILLFVLLLCVVPGCVAPGAFKAQTEIQGLRNDMDARNDIVAEQIGEVNNRITQTTKVADSLSVWRKEVQAETINYGGAGWVVVGTGVMALIFVSAGYLLIRAFMRRGNSLALLTGVIQKAGKRSPEVVHAIKRHLREEVSNGGRFGACHKRHLADFARKNGTFIEQKCDSNV